MAFKPKQIQALDINSMINQIHENMKSGTKREYVDVEGKGAIVFYNEDFTGESVEIIRQQAKDWLDEFGYKIFEDYTITETQYLSSITNDTNIAWAVWMKNPQDFTWLKIHDTGTNN